MRVLVAPDKYKGTASASDLVQATVTALADSAAVVEVDGCPLADGGEGTLEALGGPNRESLVTGPLGDPVHARWRLRRKVAVIEMAEASGLVLAGGAENNDALAASTFGTGELIENALDRGASRIIVGVGGSATTDGGWGAVQALFPAQRLRGIELLVACDVSTAFTEAAEVFGPQKGATPAQVALLRRRLERLVDVYRDEYGVDVSALAGAGAAGGLAGGLAAIGADLVPGFALVAEHLDLDERVAAADLVVTGEGAFDATSLAGKVVGGVVDLAVDAGKPMLIVVGGHHDAAPFPDGCEVVVLADRYGLESALAEPAELFARVTGEWVASGGRDPNRRSTGS